MEIMVYKNKNGQEFIKQVKICCPEMSRIICEDPQVRANMNIPFFSVRSRILYTFDKASLQIDYCPYCGEKIEVLKREYDPNTESTA